MEAVKDREAEDHEDEDTEDGDEDEEMDYEEEEEEEEEGDGDEISQRETDQENAEDDVAPSAKGDEVAPTAGPSVPRQHPGPHAASQSSPYQYRENNQNSDSDEDVEAPAQELDPELSPISGSRPLSRSPPASRHTSRSPTRSDADSLEEHTAGLSISHDRGLRDRAAVAASKQYARQQKKYHSKRGAQRIGGRQKGSKAKLDTRIKPDRSGMWD